MKTRSLLKLTALGLSLPLLSARAAAQVTLHVPGDFPTIQGAIDAATSGDTILVAAGTYHERLGIFGKPIHVVSQEGPESTTIDADDLGRAIWIAGSSAVVEGFRIFRGRGQ